MSFQRLLTVGLCLFAATGALRGQVTWTGATNSDFATSTNWSAALPTDGSANVNFSGTITTVPIVNTAFTVNSFTYASGASAFTLANSGGAGLTITTALTQNGPSVQVISAPLT